MGAVGEQAVAQEDLQHYEADLAAREQALGAEHPDVSCSCLRT